MTLLLSFLFPISAWCPLIMLRHEGVENTRGPSGSLKRYVRPQVELSRDSFLPRSEIICKIMWWCASYRLLRVKPSKVLLRAKYSGPHGLHFRHEPRFSLFPHKAGKDRRTSRVIQHGAKVFRWKAISKSFRSGNRWENMPWLREKTHLTDVLRLPWSSRNS